MATTVQSFKYVGVEITWVGAGVEEYGHVKDDPENVVVRVDPRYFRPTEVELLLVRATKSKNNNNNKKDEAERRTCGQYVHSVFYACTII